MACVYGKSFVASLVVPPDRSKNRTSSAVNTRRSPLLARTSQGSIDS
jgi:hypothetical protein